MSALGLAGLDTLARSLRGCRLDALSPALRCVVNAYKNDLGDLPVRQLLARRRAAAGQLGAVEQVLAGTLTVQSRRCGRSGCRCAGGELHGPFRTSPRARPPGRGRARYVPVGLAQVVRRYLRRGEQAEQAEQAEAALTEISAVNAELLARRELR